MSELVIKVETGSGVYELWKPRERIGVKHFAIHMKFLKIIDEYVKAGADPIDAILEDERLMELYEKWCTEVLPHIIKSSPVPKDQIPFDDQWLLFNAVMNSAKFPEVESFRQ